jgi:hypothetical protein
MTSPRLRSFPIRLAPSPDGRLSTTVQREGARLCSGACASNLDAMGAPPRFTVGGRCAVRPAGSLEVMKGDSNDGHFTVAPGPRCVFTGRRNPYFPLMFGTCFGVGDMYDGPQKMSHGGQNRDKIRIKCPRPEKSGVAAY